MKKLAVIFLVLFCSSFIKAQQYIPFPITDAIWNHNFNTGSIGNLTSSYFQYGLNGDTIINSKTLIKVYLLNDSVLNSNSTYQGCIMEDSNKRIFYIGKGFWPFENYTQPIQLYDFSKSVGDTILYGIYGKKIILSIDSILINTNYRKVYHINFDDFIEGIGSVKGLLYPITNIPTKAYTDWTLVCFKEKGSVKYLNPNYNSCFPKLSGIENYSFNEKSIKVFPNPISDLSILSWTNCNENKYVTLTINDIFGRNIKIFNVNGLNSIIINSSDYSPGIYFAILKTSNGKYSVKKIIVQ